MNRVSSKLGDQTFDVVIIGGGILGAGIARDAALRGLSVALVEQNDFASGTSSASTKLIHGGVRYLEQYAFSLVAESCRERRTLLSMAPHLVRPVPLIMPAYEGDPYSLLKLRLGNTLYDWMTFFRHEDMPRHTALSADEAVGREPNLPEKNEHGTALQGAVLMYDCQMDDARLCLETILDAERYGAVCVNYCRVTRLHCQEQRLDSIDVIDTVTHEEYSVKARCFVNATGPWAASVAELIGAVSPIRLSPTKGIHLVIPRSQREHGIYFQSRADGRMIFLLPWEDVSLLGTTDTDFSEDPGSAQADEADVGYLIDRLNMTMPAVGLQPEDVITTFAGVRALIQSDSRRPSSRSREEKLVRQGENLLHVAGGKYTTFRAVAEKGMKEIGRVLGQRLPACRTEDVPLTDHRPQFEGRVLAESPSVHESDIRHACQAEHAVTLTDVMRRRTRLALSPAGGEATATAVADLMAEELQWDDAEQSRQMQDYLSHRSDKRC